MSQDPLESKAFMKIQNHKIQIHFGRANCQLESYQIQILLSRIWSRTLKVSVTFLYSHRSLRTISLKNHEIFEILGEILRVRKNGDKIIITPETAA